MRTPKLVLRDWWLGHTFVVLCLEAVISTHARRFTFVSGRPPFISGRRGENPETNPITVAPCRSGATLELRIPKRTQKAFGADRTMKLVHHAHVAGNDLAAQACKVRRNGVGAQCAAQGCGVKIVKLPTTPPSGHCSRANGNQNARTEAANLGSKGFVNHRPQPRQRKGMKALNHATRDLIPPNFTQYWPRCCSCARSGLSAGAIICQQPLPFSWSPRWNTTSIGSQLCHDTLPTEMVCQD